MRSALQYLILCKAFQCFIPFMRMSHLLPGEHTEDMAATWADVLQHVNLGKHTLFLHLPYPHSFPQFQSDRSMVAGHVLMIHTLVASILFNSVHKCHSKIFSLVFSNVMYH